MICIHCGEPVGPVLAGFVHTRSDTRRCIANGGWYFKHAEVWPAPTAPSIECVMFGNDAFADDVTAWAVLDADREVVFIHLDKAEAERFATASAQP